MWTLTAEDIRQAKADAMQRRREIESRLEAVDSELKELEAVEKSASAFVAKYRGVQTLDGADYKSADPSAVTTGPNFAQSLTMPSDPDTRTNNWVNAGLAATGRTAT